MGSLVKCNNLITMTYILWSVSLSVGSSKVNPNVTLLVSPQTFPHLSISSGTTELPTTLSSSSQSPASIPPDETSVGSQSEPVFHQTPSTQYLIDISKPVHQTVTEVTEFVCGKLYFCDHAEDADDGEDCFACQFPCSCEAECADFGDCCVDKILDTFNSSMDSMTSCITVGEISAYMVTKCPFGYQDSSDTLQRCETPDVSKVGQTLPVGVKKSQITYRNQYCAICSGLDKTDFEKWTYKVYCQGNASINLNPEELWDLVDRSPDACSVEYLSPTGITVRHCPQRMTMTCSSDNENIDVISKKLCAQFVNPIIYRGIVYNNIFCAMCNGVLIDKGDLCGTHSDEDIDIPEVTSRPLSALMNFDPMFEPDLPTDDKEASVEPLCKIGNIYDPFLEQCLIPHCSERRILIRGVCEPIFSTAKGLGYTVFFTMIPERAISRWSTFTSEYMTMLRKILEPVYPYYIDSVRFDIFVSLGDTTGSEVFKGATVEANVLFLADSPLRIVEEILQNLFVMSWAFRSVGESIIIKTSPYSCSDNPDQLVFDRVREEMIQGSPELIANECDENCFGQIIFTEYKPTLNCPFVELSLTNSNLKYVKDTGMLVALDGRFSINASSYLKCGYTVWVCVSVLEGILLTFTTTTTTTMIPTENHTTNLEYKPTEGMSLSIVSTVCITLSMAFLILVFLVHCLLPKLRSTTGKNNILTIMTLFLAQLFFLSGHGATENIAICRTMGIIIHYFWLSSFIWLAVDAHYVYIQCSRILGDSQNQLDAKSLLIRNILISNGLPFIVVIVCISYHLANSGGLVVGYGGEVCFLSKPGDIGMYFAVPLGITLGCNIYFFVVTAGALRRMSDALEATNRPKKAVAMLYFKWSMFIGVSWVFGCLAAALNSEALWYIFIILCGFQGIFIFVTFCANEFTWKMLKEKFEKLVPKKIPDPGETLDTTSSKV